MPRVRASVRVSGKVQGVYFRWATLQEAAARGITGWVRNNPDGTVEAVFEGDEERVKSLVEWCSRGPDAARVDRVDVKWEDYTGEFSDFTIRR